jgi:hypothetical protein
MENIQVAVRVRPFNLKEKEADEKNPWIISDDSIIFDTLTYESVAKNYKTHNLFNRNSFAYSNQKKNLKC